MSSQPVGQGTHDFREAGWFPVDLDVQNRRYGFLALDEGVLLRSSFLDTRIEAPLDALQPVAVADIPHSLPQAQVSWLFHTSFCGSTLAARALHLPPYTACLREPMVLRRLGDARRSGRSLEGLVEPTVGLLSRPWRSHGAVVIKPTHAALNVATDLLAATPTSRAVILTSSLEDFLVSNLKKPVESQSRIPELAERALRAGTFAGRLPKDALEPPDLLGVAVLQWAAQRELALDIIESAGAGRVRVAGLDWLLADLPEAMERIRLWLGLVLPAEALREHCAQVAARNAKAVGSPYGPDQRAREAAMVTDMFREPLARALAWAEHHVFPAMRSVARQDPQPWASA